ncbi:periodic tryptophan protein 2, putative [Hepatocystis sp. ex Piliocolobus tephrosceles]|nr:periodic tryptophan protein 2, putative [Hepatocystis sp. ex Piliocolobus tephrosceles]
MLNYNLSNICGSFYTGGKMAFSEDGNSLFVPVNNRVNVYDLHSNTCNTLKSENRNDLRYIALHPNMELAITIDKFGHGCLINLRKDQIILRILFKSKTGMVTSFNYNNILKPQEEQDAVNCAKFNNNGKYFLVGIGRRVVIWKSPCKKNNFRLIKYNDICYHSLNITFIDISDDDKYFLSTSYDLTVRIHTIKKEKNIRPTVLSGNKTTIIGAFFSKCGKYIFSVNKSGLIILWVYESVLDIGQEGWFGESTQVDLKHRDSVVDPIKEELVKESESVEESEVIPPDELEVTPPDELEVTPPDELEVTPPDELEVTPPPDELEVTPPDELEVTPPDELEVTPPDELEVTPSNNLEVKNRFRNKLALDKRWCYKKIYYCNQEKGSEVVKTCFNKECNLLVITYSNGVFGIYNTPGMISIYNISINTNSIDDVVINKDGQWIGLAESTKGTIIIWEWKSESYILKQTTSNKNVICVKFSPIISHLKIGSQIIDNMNTYHDSDSFTSKFVIVTGNEDGTIKLYDYLSFLNFVTFTAHSSSVTDICFLPQGNAFISCSLDGTVRAFDLLRYRNFKIYTPDEINEDGGSGGSDKKRGDDKDNTQSISLVLKKKQNKLNNVQFLCVSVNLSGNIVAAGGRGNEYIVYVWNVQTAQCVDKLYGHNSPIIKICFSTNLKSEGIIATCSNNKKVLIWDLYVRRSRGNKIDNLNNNQSISCMCFDPRGNDILAVCTLGCKIIFFDVNVQEIIGSIEGERDIQSGRLLGEKCSNIPMSKKYKKRLIKKKGKEDLKNSAMLKSSYNFSKKDNNEVEEYIYEDDVEEEGNSIFSNLNLYFTSIDYIHNGNYIVGCVNKSIALYIYDTNLYLLIKIINLTTNYCIDGMSREISTRYLTKEGKNIYEFDLSGDEGDIFEDNLKMAVKRKKRQEVGISSLPGQIDNIYLNSKYKKFKFILNYLNISADDRHIAVATNVGLYIFTKDYQYQYCPTITSMYKGLITTPMIYNPNFLTQDITVYSLKNALNRNEYIKAFIFALALNNYESILEVYEHIPYNLIPLCVKMLNKQFVLILINFIKMLLTNDTIKHIHLHLLYLYSIFSCHLNIFFNNDMYTQMGTSGGGSGSKNITNTNDRTRNSLSSNEARTSLLFILQKLFVVHNGLQYLYSNNINVLLYFSTRGG